MSSGIRRQLWPAVVTAIADAQSGGRAAAARTLEDCWHAASAIDDHALKCIIAHYLADLQGDSADELLWNQRALESHSHVAADGFQALGVASAEQLLPSLHLNLGDDWLRAGDPVLAEYHLRQGIVARHVLNDDGYGQMITRGLDGLADRVAQQSADE